MRKSVALSAVFLVAILLELSGRLPLLRGDKPAADQGAAANQGQDSFARPSQASSPSDKPPAASKETRPVRGDDPFGSNLDSAPGKAASAQPQSAEAKPARKMAKKARPQTIAPSPQPSRLGNMKMTLGKPSSQSAAAAMTASEELIEKALLRPVTLDMLEPPLCDVADELSRQLNVNVIVDARGLNDVGTDPMTPVTCQLKNLPLRFALDELLRPLEMTWIIRNGTLVVTTLEQAEKQLTTRVYDVSSLLANPPDYPACRSGDLDDSSPLFGPSGERNHFGAGYGMGVGGMGMGGFMNVGAQPASPPVPQQQDAVAFLGTDLRTGESISVGDY